MMVEKNKEKDCPAELVELFDASKGAWRKGVIKQFMESYEWRKETDRKLATIHRYEKAVVALLLLIVTAVLTQIVPYLWERLLAIL